MKDKKLMKPQNFVDKIYETTKARITKVKEQKGEGNLTRYFRRCNQFLYSTKWVKDFVESIKIEYPEFYGKLMKLLEVKPRFLEERKGILRLLLIDKMNRKLPYEGFSNPLVIAIEETIREGVIGSMRKGGDVKTDLLGEDENLRNLALLMGYSSVSKEEASLSVLRHLARVKRLGRANG